MDLIRLWFLLTRVGCYENHCSGLIVQSTLTGLDYVYTGLTFFYAKNHFCALMKPHSAVGLAMRHFSLFKPGHTILSM